MFCVWRSGRPSRGQFSLSLMWDPGLEITSSVPCGKRFTCSAIPAPNTVWIPCVQQKEKGKKASNVACILFVFIVFENIFTCLYIKSEKKKGLLPTKFKNIQARIWGPCGYTVCGCPVHNEKRKRREKEREREEMKTQRRSFVFLSGGGGRDAEWPARRLHSRYLLVQFFSKLVF